MPPQREYPVVLLGCCQVTSRSRLLDPEGFLGAGGRQGKGFPSTWEGAFFLLEVCACSIDKQPRP